MNQEDRLLHLSDEQWAQIENSFPRRRGRSGFERQISNRLAFEAVLYRQRVSGGQEGDAPVGEALLAEVLAYEEIKAVGGDRAYASDAIRALITAAGKEAVIPPRRHRRQPATYDKEKYKQRNKAERLFNKLKGYRGVATRYDKLAAMFLGGVLATLLAVSLRCILNTP